MPNPYRHARAGDERQPQARGLAVTLTVVLLAFVLSSAAAAPSRLGALEAEERASGQLGLELLQQVGGASRAVAAHGDYVYLAVGPRLVVLDVSNPPNVHRVGQSPVLPGRIRSLSLDESGSYAYVASERPEIYILDVSDPRAPVWLNSFVLEPKPGASEPGGVGIREQAGYLYLATGTSGLRIVDIRDPTAPVEVGRYWDAESVNTVLPINGLAYIHCYCDGWINKFRILDISDPSDITLRSDYERPVVPGTLVGHTLVVGVPGQRAVDLLDVSEPDNPREAGSVVFRYFPLAKATKGNYLYVTLATSDQQMEVVDISNPLEPRVVGSQLGVNNIVLVAEGSYLFAIAENDLQVIDVSVPARLRQAGRYPLLPTGISVKVAGDRAYTTGTNSGIEIYDIVDPLQPIKLGQADRVQRAAAATNGYVVTAGGGLSLVDVADPTRPSVVGSFDGSVFAAAVAWPRIYASDAFGGLTVLDASTPSQLAPVGFAPALQMGPGRATISNVAVAGSYVYVAASSGHLRVIDVTNPTNPLEVGSINLGVDGSGVTIDGPYAYVADGRAGLRIIDVSDPTIPSEVGSFDTPCCARAVAVRAGFAYVADERGGLRVIDISDPTSPSEVASYDLPGSAEDVALHGDDIVVAARDAGLWIFRFRR